MKRINTFILALALLSSLWPTVTVAQQAPANMGYHTVWGRRGAAPGDTGPAQAIPFATLALDLAQTGIGGVYASAGGQPCVGGLTLYASPTGSGNCLITSACTLPTACSLVKQISTFVESSIHPACRWHLYDSGRDQRLSNVIYLATTAAAPLC